MGHDLDMTLLSMEGPTADRTCQSEDKGHDLEAIVCRPLRLDCLEAQISREVQKNCPKGHGGLKVAIFFQKWRYTSQQDACGL